MRSTTSAIVVNGILPPRNASTATSSAAFRTHGAVPPASPASRARRRQGNVSRSGSSKVSSPTAASSSVGSVDVGALGVVERIGDRHPHVGNAEMGQRSAVVQVDERVDDRLWMHRDLDPLVAEPNR